MAADESLTWIAFDDPFAYQCRVDERHHPFEADSTGYCPFASFGMGPECVLGALDLLAEI
jgi:hypothetical protein